MRRRLAAHPEVIRRSHYALAEMPAPDSIHYHSRGQLILRAGHPIRELPAAAAFLFRRNSLPAQDSEKTARRLRTGDLRIALNKDSRVDGRAFRDPVNRMSLRLVKLRRLRPDLAEPGVGV